MEQADATGTKPYGKTLVLAALLFSTPAMLLWL